MHVCTRTCAVVCRDRGHAIVGVPPGPRVYVMCVRAPVCLWLCIHSEPATAGVHYHADCRLWIGSLVKGPFARARGIAPDRVYHVTIMPCFDKKLEASRDDFFDQVLAFWRLEKYAGTGCQWECAYFFCLSLCVSFESIFYKNAVMLVCFASPLVFHHVAFVLLISRIRFCSLRLSICIS